MFCVHVMEESGIHSRAQVTWKQYGLIAAAAASFNSPPNTTTRKTHLEAKNHTWRFALAKKQSAVKNTRKIYFKQLSSLSLPIFLLSLLGAFTGNQ